MKKWLTFVCFISYLLLSKPLFSERFTAASEIRLRYEFQNCFNQKYYGEKEKMGNKNDTFLLGRFRFGFDYWKTKHIHLKLWFQDAEVWDMALPDRVFYNKKDIIRFLLTSFPRSF